MAPCQAGSALRKIERLHADPALRNVVSSPAPRLTIHAEGDQVSIPKVSNEDAFGSTQRRVKRCRLTTRFTASNLPVPLVLDFKVDA